jgi:hypothetical protein
MSTENSLYHPNRRAKSDVRSLFMDFDRRETTAVIRFDASLQGQGIILYERGLIVDVVGRVRICHQIGQGIQLHYTG